ncbi:MAG: hypothetical protein LC101_07280 [Flavobacteriales bacterium]|nr:hypothetical protein [Flavobacteriales bacterium]
MASKYKRSFGKEERTQCNMLYAEARSLSADTRKIETFIINDIIVCITYTFA